MERFCLEQAEDYVARVRSSAARMAQLLDELLEMSRVGRVRDEPERVGPRAVLDEVTREMAERFAERGVEVAVQPDLPTDGTTRAHSRRRQGRRDYRRPSTNATSGCRTGARRRGPPGPAG